MSEEIIVIEKKKMGGWWNFRKVKKELRKFGNITKNYTDYFIWQLDQAKIVMCGFNEKYNFKPIYSDREYESEPVIIIPGGTAYHFILKHCTIVRKNYDNGLITWEVRRNFFTWEVKKNFY